MRDIMLSSAARRTAPPGSGQRRRLYYNNYSQESRAYTGAPVVLYWCAAAWAVPHWSSRAAERSVGEVARMRRRARTSSGSGGHPAPTARHSPPVVPCRPRPFLLAVARPFHSSLRVIISPPPTLRRALIAADATAVGDCACACATRL